MSREEAAVKLNRKQRRGLARSVKKKFILRSLATGTGISSLALCLLLFGGQADAFAVPACAYQPPLLPSATQACDPNNVEGHCFAGGYIYYGPGKVSGTEASISRDNPGESMATEAWVMVLKDNSDLAQVGWIKVSSSFVTGLPGQTGIPLTATPGYFYEIHYVPTTPPTSTNNTCLNGTAPALGICVGQVFLNALPTTNLTDSDSYAVWVNGGQLEFQINNGKTLSVPFGTISVSSNCANDNVPWAACAQASTSDWSAEMFDYGDEVPGSVSTPATFSGLAHLCPSGCNPPWVPDTDLSTSNFGTDDCNGKYSQSGSTNAFTIFDARRTSTG